MDMLELSRKLHPLERKVLPNLEKTISFEQLVEKCGMQEVEVMRAVQWMENKGIVTVKKEEKEIISLDRNGLDYKKNGLPEKRFLDAVKDKALSLAEIGKKAGLDQNELSISMGLLRKKNAIDVKKDKELIVSISKEGKEFLKKETAEEKFLDLHFPVEESKLEKDQKAVFDEFMKRKEIVKKDRRAMREISLTGTGEKLSKLKISDNVADKLTSKMLKEGSWQKKEFRKYDVEINVPKISGGKRHFTNQAVEYIKNIWLDLGFREMTGNMVQTSFWDLDALFVPQDHPARDMQDTFYLKTPKKGKLPDARFVKRVKATHENGWTTGSQGWKSAWDAEKAKENLLRTHTTVLSAQTIASLKKEDLPAKFFAVGKCFRNETMDWKHLFEFYQVEGIVVDPDANFRNLLGYLKEFFRKMGYPDVRIRPGHFPYTEPSAEVDVWHPVKKEWVELGGSGIFRPEVTKPLFGTEVPVLAWGLGLDRIIKENWNIKDIRELYKNDLKQLREMKIWLK
ncbi:TPA: phenylalanine--tRNA ligase subunit alpha [Candidatus Woesearchaeota archaeon]|nr:Phenylalanine-tRNA ligase alpha subunit [archaeon GW2011_AR15]MBS3104203.1 phenylalanine--tRNA ligase subunit alpha [Candidatus Woesearchaeota archaeon]HIH41967.1 phenylalanine--tRNA ligase subunit alpha [Candidatus Woesearchaeota archaeon]